MPHHRKAVSYTHLDVYKRQWGVAAAGIGSAMADLLTGYAYYAPATLIIKALMAVAAFYIEKCFMNGSYFKSLVGKVIGGAVAEIIMVAGYFVYAIILYGNVATAAAGDVYKRQVL